MLNICLCLWYFYDIMLLYVYVDVIFEWKWMSVYFYEDVCWYSNVNVIVGNVWSVFGKVGDIVFYYGKLFKGIF